MNQAELKRQKLFYQLAVSVSKNKEGNFISKILNCINKVKFFLMLCADLVIAFTLDGTNWKTVLEGSLTVAQYILACCLVFSVAVYGSKGRCLTFDFLLIGFGIYDFQWMLRKDSNDRLHRPKIVDFLKANENNDGDGTRYKRFTREDLQAVTSLIKNKLVDARIGLVYSVVAELLISITKIYFVLYLSTDLCSIQNVFRTLVIACGIFDCIKAIVKEEWLTMKYLKMLNLLDSYELRDFHTFNSNHQTKITQLATVLFHSIAISYRILIILSYFQLGHLIGFLHLTALIASSTFQYKVFRPKYENGPAGAPTNMYGILEVIYGLFTTRHLRISSCLPLVQAGHAIKFILIKLIEHFVLLFIFVNVCKFLYPSNYPIDVHPKNPLLPLPCENPLYNFISSSFSAFKFTVSYSDTYLQLLLKNLILLGTFCFFLTYTIVYFAYLHFGGLNDNRFPARVGTHIWDHKFLNKQWDQIPPAWILRMMLYTVSSQPLELLKELPAEILGSKKWERLLNQELRTVKIPASTEALRHEVLQYRAPMRRQLRSLSDYIYSGNNNITNVEMIRYLRGLLYLFCVHFEECMMLNMDSYKISCICSLLGECPIVRSDFIDDQISDSWLWVFK